MREAVLRTRDFVVEALREAGAGGEVLQDLSAQELALTVIGTVFARSPGGPSPIGTTFG